jgi:ferredoxin-NADP reductase
MEHSVKIISVDQITHDVKRFRCEKPEGYNFEPGQATEVSINRKGWENEKRPFTFTSLNEQPFLEFTIKIYDDHKGVTNELNKLIPKDELIVRDIWGAINYKGEGYFIAGGAGITPFIAILRQLKKENKISSNKLFFSNKTEKDIILKEELIEILGPENIHFIISREMNSKRNQSGRIDQVFLKQKISNVNKQFYLCGPDKMVIEINNMLLNLGVIPETIIFEK